MCSGKFAGLIDSFKKILFPKTFIFSSLETFALQRKQTWEVKIFFGVSMALIANSNQHTRAEYI